MGNNTKQQKVVFQLSNHDPLVHKAMVKQLNNLLTAFEKGNIQTEVVVHGPGIELLLQESPLKNNLESLHRKGVLFLVCQNTLQEKKIAPDRLLPFSQIIPAGIAHVIVRQSEGWSYIKVGF
ncbi:hypothetical protein EFA69_18495 [Rufibacter immobilis]|uniref:Uncharacterized protein n=1 Tax=Rufibacter immobilis TaxID=1348778 RepID=A0A3M9MTK9_9BACT|nr:DsrE family protein [Rufibacter immobilis]RNI28068.1 hypothetical protein EFA69_18495 [Rufibacter immobilis]